MVLSDSVIISRLDEIFPEEKDRIRIKENESVYIQPASVDLTLGTNIAVAKLAYPGSVIVPESLDTGRFYKYDTIPRRGYLLRPGSQFFFLAETAETIHMPEDLVGRVDGRSSYGRLGVRIHSTAGFIDPGFTGRITLEIDLVGRHPILLRPGARVCQITFESITGKVRSPYGSARGSKYSGRYSGNVQLSKIKEDKK